MEDAARARAVDLDSRDPLAGFRNRFVIPDPELIYLDGNSLGRLTQGVAKRIQQAVEDEWGASLIRSWNGGWWEAPSRIGGKLARLVGAHAEEVMVTDQTSVNLFKLVTAALKLRADRQRIVTDTLNFPSDLYIVQGLVEMLGGRHEIVRIGSRDSDVTPDLEALLHAMNEQTALVTLSHVTFKSGYLYDMREITELAHRSARWCFGT